ncbi:MAG: putative Ig domain-containing protein [Blastocatellales bacterium]
MKKNHRKTLLTVVGAAIIALCAAAAILFPAQPAAGQETKQQTLRGEAALERLKQDGQYESLQAAMREARLSVSLADDTPLGRSAWRAPNPAAGYDAYVTEEGVSLVVGQDGILSHKEAAIVSLHLRGIGYGDAMQSVAPGEVTGDKQTINIARNSGVREWFVNSPEGLEHGFTLSEPLGARRQGEPLRLALQVSAGWRAVASDDGKLVTLRGPNDQAIEYGKLVVRDNLGRNIPARLTVAEEQVVIEVEDHDAQYPLTIDPLFALQQMLTAADGVAGDQFGGAVALSGNTAAVGANLDDVSGKDQGSVYVFVRNGAKWTLQGRLAAQDGAAEDYFGQSVALDGDTLVVGASRDDVGANADQGAAYVFTRSGTLWTQQSKLIANDGGGSDNFGLAVALSGDTVVVGAPSGSNGASPNQGAAYIFIRSGAGQPVWTQQQKLNAVSGASGDSFGNAVALDGGTVVVGAAQYDGGILDKGAAYVFVRSSTGWALQQRLTANDGAVKDRFGWAVALSGDTVIVGAPYKTPGTNGPQGSVYVFTRSNTNWTQQQKLTASDGALGDQFGWSVALSGDTALVGAYTDSIGVPDHQGSAYVFLRYAANWAQQRKLFAAEGRKLDLLGFAVALDHDTALVGAVADDIGANEDQGSAYVFVVRDNRSVEQQRLIANDGAGEEQFGRAVALDGDTLAVGANEYDPGPNQGQGAVYVFTRGGAAQPVWTLQQKLFANDGVVGNAFGRALALDADTLAIGAPGDGVVNTGPGAAYIFVRNGAVWTQQKKLLAGGGANGDGFGKAIALDGDTVAVGAPGDDINANQDQGSAHVFTRSGADWTLQGSLNSFGGAAFEGFGAAIALEGDNLVVGIPYFDFAAKQDQGKLEVFERSGTNWAFRMTLSADDGAAGDQLGAAVALNGDTVVAGAPLDKIGANVNQGSVYVFLRGEILWAQEKKLTAPDGAPGDYFGEAVALSGDTVVIGAEEDTVGARAHQGSAYVFTRGGAVWTFQHQLTASDGASNDGFGKAVALDGDTIVAGAWHDTIGAVVDQGSAYVFVNRPCPAVTIAPESLLNGAIGAAYNQQLTVSDNSQDAQWMMVLSGVLPPGLTLGANGLLHGTPVEAGTYRFTVTATYARSLCSGSREYTLTITPQINNPVVTCVSAASYRPGGAPESIIAVFGQQMATQTQGAAGLPLPTELAGVRVTIRDSQGAERLAPLFFVAPGQINLVIPAGTAVGAATVMLSSGATGQLEINSAAPGLFAANADGQGVPAAVVLRVRANGSSLYEPVARLEGARFAPAPIDLGPAGDQVFLVLYGTGLRFRQTVSASVGGANANVLFAGAAAGFAGLDQVNLSLPRSLIGRGEVDVTLRVDGVAANTVRISVR